MTDWKRNNKIALRNFTEPSDFHDLVKTLLVRMLRRKHPDNSKTYIYTEFNPSKPNEDYPDIWMRTPSYTKTSTGKRLKSPDIYVFELQDKVTGRWLKQIQAKHQEVNLIIIPLKEVYQLWLKAITGPLVTKRPTTNIIPHKIIKSPINALKNILEVYVI